MDLRSDFALSLVDLRRQEGTRKDVTASFAAPADFGTDLLKVPEGEPIDGDLVLQSVSEGVLITGTITADAKGQCARCLTHIVHPIDEDLAELAFYPERRAALVEDGDDDVEERPEIVNDRVDLEPLIRDAVIPTLPFIPLCSEDCEGLCSVCGERLADLPDDHAHEDEPTEQTPLDRLRAQLVSEQGEPED